jgi:lipoprotein NlpD
MIPTNGTYTAPTQTVNTYSQPTQSVPAFPQNINQSQPSYGTQNYTVQSGDTIYSIGRKFNVNPNYIINKNPNINPSQLQPGQVLNIVSANQTVNKSITQSTQTIDNKKIDIKPVLTQSTVASNNNTPIMGEKTPVAQVNDDLEKQILSNALMLPVKGSIKENKNLRGILISASDGDAVKASAAGEVIYVGNLNNYGNMVLVKHDNGLVTNYARLKKTFVQKGQKVNKGDLIASAGTSDDFKTSDVLFEVRKGTKAVNPLDYIG